MKHIKHFENFKEIENSDKLNENLWLDTINAVHSSGLHNFLMGFWQWCKEKSNGIPNGISAGTAISTISGLFLFIRYEVRKWSKQEKEKAFKATAKGLMNKETPEQIAKKIKNDLNESGFEANQKSRKKVMAESVKNIRNKKRI